MLGNSASTRSREELSTILTDHKLIFSKRPGHFPSPTAFYLVQNPPICPNHKHLTLYNSLTHHHENFFLQQFTFMAFLFLSLTLFFFVFFSFPSVHSLSTVSILSESSNQTIICALIQSSHPHHRPKSHVKCTNFPGGSPVPLRSTSTSFSGIVGGNGFVCGLTNSTSVMGCWRFSPNGRNVSYKRIYSGPELSELDAGNSHICGLVAGTNRLACWQWRDFSSNTTQFVSNIAVGGNFVCGLLEFGQIKCLGNYTSVTENEPDGNFSVVAAGFRHACGIYVTGDLKCWGEMAGEKPQGVFKSLALGENRSCAIRTNGTAVCWGENGFGVPENLKRISYEAIEVNRGVFCGIATSNYSLYCWGNEIIDYNPFIFKDVVPGPCRTKCPCSPYPNYGKFCSQGQMVCETCVGDSSGGNRTLAVSPEPPRSGGIHWSKKMVAFLAVGCVGSLSVVIVSCVLISRYFERSRGSGRVHDSGPLDEIATPRALEDQQVPRVLEKRLSQMFSMGNGGNLEEFTFPTLREATINFSDERKIGSGSFGSVYRATLQDGREVAIKRAELSISCHGGGRASIDAKRRDDNEYAFINELECLSRLNHKNLVRLLGFCEDCGEYALVYEYMNNGSLHDHLHNVQNTQSSATTSWVARIRVALDAARGIEYLHAYAVPPIIHRDIKSSNILLDATWTAKVSDFGLSLMGPQENMSHLSLHAAGTIGYIDPEYFRLQQLTTKSDVYSFGVLLLELLSGYKAIHLNEERMPRNVVDYVVPYIIGDDIRSVLDPKVPQPKPFEAEAIAYIGYLAADCVTLEGQDRPTMTDIANSLEKALVACVATPSLYQSITSSSSKITIVS